ncbi:hypothetical protein OG912_16875 [Streptomyces sp. NBC_00464]|uniref:hypothetical protein n=1 Tax=Streptomyces sp. NBC_00464 TaxID=2975751 RepID=UPI002E177EDC
MNATALSLAGVATALGIMWGNARPWWKGNRDPRPRQRADRMKRTAAIQAATTGALQRLGTGHATLQTRLTTTLTAWVHRGRREDLEGLAAALGCWLRLAIIGAASAGLFLLVRSRPRLMWILAALWALAAWRAAAAPRPAEKVAPGTPEEHQPDRRDAVLRLLYEALGDRPAMFLSEVLQSLQKRGHMEGRTVADLRARLEALRIPVEMRLKQGGRGPTRGVVRSQLPPLPPSEGTEASLAPSTAA